MPKRKHLPAETKISIVRQHVLEGRSVADLCDEYGVHATQVYTWQKQLFEEGSVVFERKKNSSNQQRQEEAQAAKIKQLEAKLQKKNEVVAELLEEHVQLKKELGEP